MIYLYLIFQIETFILISTVVFLLIVHNSSYNEVKKEKRMKMKKYYMICSFLFALGFVTITAHAMDSVNPGHNSNFYLQYGSGSTLCTDTSSAHSYWTSGNALNTRDTRLAVYVTDSSGTVKASSSSSSYSTWAGAQWTRSQATSHGHRATSGLIQ